ncbi:hypothetical protein VTN96DRAFT_3141 [Rasamsonia emersonii]|uniref:Uncharacterized protein n=1 Tax=Rasamsonia emersonii (strain ATCC 16479 / CBS 393.64 / IMI 116815) TaxID=1408163 RepID=A0A0F4Z262_RASE3|nr:hypothetical protein T310_1479 [Rasamsonia emersonii CBS 393.64]KKA24450.1 hypothetical protein T310_1479 [Rasamsonia emersonii CBS 393.64]
MATTTTCVATQQQPAAEAKAARFFQDEIVIGRSREEAAVASEKTVVAEYSAKTNGVVPETVTSEIPTTAENAVNHSDGAAVDSPVAADDAHVSVNGVKNDSPSTDSQPNGTAVADQPQVNGHSADSPVDSVDRLCVASTQQVLLLHAPKEKYTLVTDHAVPSIIHDREVLIKISAIGLNPIDWKAPAFNFGIPGLPWIFGRDLAGTVIQTSANSRLKVGDVVLVPSTDYRDIRKAAFQEYAIATDYNAARIPAKTSIHAGASLGVAFVAAALALGISFGLDFGNCEKVPGPDLLRILRGLDPKEIPEDVRDECLSSVSDSERVKPGEWVAIWGASTTTGYIALQLAKLCGLKVICVADIARHGARLLDAGADLLVDRYDTTRAVEIVRGVTQGRLRFGVDMVGRETATILQQALFASEHDGPAAHLIGLTGMPKEKDARIRYHAVPIKIFHSSPAVGESMVTWVERLLETNSLTLPEVIIRREGGLADVNDALELLRDGSVGGKRIVIDMGAQN